MINKTYGRFTFPGKVDITDPCYDKNVWCRINDFKISEGEYECYTDIADGEETHGWGERVARIGIRKGILCDEYRREGSIGVDAGLAGFFADKPDYTDEEWAKLCSKIREGEAWITEDGFFSNSGYGDGCYDVYAGYRDGEIVEVYIDFIE